MSRPTGVSKKVENFSAQEGPRRRVDVNIGGGQLSAVVVPKTITELPSYPRPTLLQNSIPKVPWDDCDGGVVQVWSYFQRVYRKNRSEAFVWWHWDAETSKYFAVVPPFYYASGGGLQYPNASSFCRTCRVALYDHCNKCPHCAESVISRLVTVGTSHSHGSMSPFHSAEDHANELGTTGFHITFGHLDRDLPVAPSFVIADGNQRFNTGWEHHFEFDDSGVWTKRVSLWETLVSNERSQIGRARFQVVDTAGEVAFVHGDEDQCKVWIRSRTDSTDFTIRQDVTVAEAPTRTKTLTATAERTSLVEALLRDRPESKRAEKTDEPKPVRKVRWIADPRDFEDGSVAYDWIDSVFGRVPDAYLSLAVMTALDDVLLKYEMEDERDDDPFEFARHVLDEACQGSIVENWYDLFLSCLDSHHRDHPDDVAGVIQAIAAYLIGTDLNEMYAAVDAKAAEVREVRDRELRLELKERIATHDLGDLF